MPARPLHHRSGCAARAKGAFVIATAMAVGGLGWLTLHLLADGAANAQQGHQLPAVARWMLGQRAWLPGFVVPPAIIGAWLVAANPRMTTAWLGLTLASLWLCTLAAMILITFIACMAPLYQYQPI